MSTTRDDEAGEQPIDPEARTAALGEPALDGAPADVRPGKQVGRYVILSRAGRGGMGVVYKAYDPELERPVALKRWAATPTDDESGTDAPRRLLREAQALAKLSHPNIVPVYDVGMDEGGVFVAMEFIKGKSLKEWADDDKPTRKAIIAAYVEAGRGLSAAHGAGLTHRDFKPHNAMLGEDGRVRVVDFGLARFLHASKRNPPALASESPSSRLEEFTVTGQILGTPAYMAPEQISGSQADHLSDQFSFCVSLYEALYGQRPFSGNTLRELAQATHEGELRDVPVEPRVPAWLRRILVRGLRADPSKRYPDMHALLNDIENDPAVRRRRWLLGAAVTAGFAGALWLTANAGSTREPPCRGVADKVAAVYNPSRMQTLRAVFARSGFAQSEAASQRVEESLDDYTQRWAKSWQNTCEATHVRGEQSAALLDTRMHCLDRRLQKVNALLGGLERGHDETTVSKSVEAVSQLPDLYECQHGHSQSLIAPLPREESKRRAVTQALRAADNLGTLLVLGQFKKAAQEAPKLRAQLDPIKHGPTRAEILYELGLLHKAMGERSAASQTFLAAIDAAIDGRDHAKAVRSWSELTHILLREGKTEQARATLSAGKQAASAVPENAEVTEEIVALESSVLRQQGRLRDARDKARKAFESRRRRVSHFADRGLASFEANLGDLERSLGQFDSARSHLVEALARAEALYGPDHPGLTATLNNLALVFESTGQYKKAETMLRRTLDIARRQFSSDHPENAPFLHNLGTVLLAQGKFDAARAHFLESKKVLAMATGDDGPFVAIPTSGLANVAYEQGNYAGAIAGQQRAITLLRPLPGHPAGFDMHVGLGKAYLANGQPTLALAPLRAAIKMQTEDAVQAAIARAWLARAMWAAGPDRKQAVRHATDARAVLLKGFGANVDKERRRLEVWLAARRD